MELGVSLSGIPVKETLQKSSYIQEFGIGSSEISWRNKWISSLHENSSFSKIRSGNFASNFSNFRRNFPVLIYTESKYVKNIFVSWKTKKLQPFL